MSAPLVWVGGEALAHGTAPPFSDLAWPISPKVLAQAPGMAGNTLTLNGISLTVPWMQREGRLGIADYGLTDSLGLRLLNSEAVERQPVQWFNDPGQSPLVLSAWVQGGHRYLDIQPLVDRYGWAIALRGQSLQIATPTPQIQSIRQVAQPWGERLIIQVSGPVVTQITESSGAYSLTLAATISESVARAGGQPPTGSGFRPLQISAAGPNTRITGAIATPHARPQISTQTNPHQILVDLRPDHLLPLNILWANGLRWRQQFFNVAGQVFPVYWLQINPTQAGLTLRPIWTAPTTATGTMPLQTMAQRWQAAAAINAGFFNRNNQYPLGAVRYNNDWISGPILSRGVVGWNNQGTFRLDRLFLKQTLTTANGQSFPIQAINSGYVQAGIGLYTPAWGPTYQPILEAETVVTVVNNQVTSQQLTTGATQLPIPIPPNGYLLALRSYATAARALVPGTPITVTSELLPANLEPMPQIVGGGPLLIKAQRIVLDPELEQFSRAFATQAAPRSALGLTATGELLLVAVHQSPTGTGPTLGELAQIMAQLGSTDALNLDGGSSASLYLGGRLINRHPRTAARVANGIGVFFP
ncbi:MAG TPA: phosphodiester glycosidase family protein [Leptolyngbyaceae cyanobacterium M65_K2018_010]|nr:phosphodiester glycosidase family protein [Leptolyngbyaceae cyanobacterium M65_K2018_010]